MAITSQSYYRKGTLQRAVILYDNNSTYEYDDTIQVLIYTVALNAYQQYCTDLLDNQHYKYVPPPPPAWASQIPANPPEG